MRNLSRVLNLKLEQNRKQTVQFLVVMFCAVVVLLVLFFLSAIPWTFAYLEIGRLVGPIPGLEYFILILLVVAIPLVSYSVPMKLKKSRTLVVFVLTLFMSLAISSLVVVSSSIVFMPQVSQAGKKIDTFIANNSNMSFPDYVNNVSFFLNNNVGSAYNKPEASFRIDNQISSTLLDSRIMQIWGLTRGDLIVYQGWGTCGQAALLIGELLQRAGYETRQAYFKNIDHQWAEVKYNGTWLIIDPWYIGNLVQAQNLKGVKPDFQNASGVDVQYSNGTWIDASHEHGY